MSHRKFLALVFIPLPILATPVAAAPHECLIEPAQVIELRAPLEGLIERVAVDRGDAVKAGQVLVVLDTAVDRARLDLAKYKAEMRGAVQAADSRLDFSAKKLKRQHDLFKNEVVSALEYDEIEANKNLAAAERVEALDNTQVARLEVREQEEMLRLKTIRSPFDGVVMERRHHPGEVARSDDHWPILKLARVDPLYVEVILPAALLGQLKVGDAADITPEAGVSGPMTARINVIDAVVDAASGTFGVRLELRNPGQRIPAGVRCQADFKRLADATVPAAGGAAVSPPPNGLNAAKR